MKLNSSKWIAWNLSLILGIFLQSSMGHSNDIKQDSFIQWTDKIDSSLGASLPIQSNGRRKPLESLARESLLYLTGKYQMWGIKPLPFYWGLMTFGESADLPLIEIRFPPLREKLGLSLDRRHYSVNEIRKTELMTLAQPLSEKQESNRRTLTELENKTLELAHQVFLAEDIIQGGPLLTGLGGGSTSQMPKDSNHGGMNSGSMNGPRLQELFETIKSGLREAQLNESAKIEKEALDAIEPGDRIPLESKIKLELLYNQVQPFLWAAWFSFLIFVLLLIQARRKIFKNGIILSLSTIPVLLLAMGFYLRVSITGFAPVTNMFGTMLWVSFGVSLFSLLFFIIYKHCYLAAILNCGVFALLLLTQQIPLVLSPDMDPIVAVLRSNFWLTIHVLTITISYASFTIAMILGNMAIIRSLLGKADNEFIKTYSHFTYRAIQLGVFLLTAGIILGGVWADYSWGRFWGWDPKETWALIADLGFIVLLHARYVQWIDKFGLMLFSPIAYLLVVMAWYGVNFILGAGLHSYGFSSGGASIVAIFVSAQLILFVLSLIKNKFQRVAK